MAEAALAAAAIREDGGHLTTFLQAYHWFGGRNSLGLPLADPLTGGCYDGLHRGGLNRNQGAESTLAWLWTLWLGTTTRHLENLLAESLPSLSSPASLSSLSSPEHSVA